MDERHPQVEGKEGNILWKSGGEQGQEEDLRNKFHESRY